MSAIAWRNRRFASLNGSMACPQSRHLQPLIHMNPVVCSRSKKLLFSQDLLTSSAFHSISLPVGSDHELPGKTIAACEAAEQIRTKYLGGGRSRAREVIDGGSRRNAMRFYGLVVSTWLRRVPGSISLVALQCSLTPRYFTTCPPVRINPSPFRGKAASSKSVACSPCRALMRPLRINQDGGRSWQFLKHRSTL